MTYFLVFLTFMISNSLWYPSLGISTLKGKKRQKVFAIFLCDWTWSVYVQHNDVLIFPSHQILLKSLEATFRVMIIKILDISKIRGYNWLTMWFLKINKKSLPIVASSSCFSIKQYINESHDGNICNLES